MNPKIRILWAYGLGFVTMAALANLVTNPDRPAHHSVIPIVIVLLNLAALLRSAP